MGAIKCRVAKRSPALFYCPIVTSHSPQKILESRIMRLKARANSKKGVAIAAAAVLIVLCAGLYYAISAPDRAARSFFAGRAPGHLGYDLFYPNKLPAGYALDPRNISYGGGAVAFQATNAEKVIFISIQQLPENTEDLDNIVENKVPFATEHGSAYVGTLGNRHVGSLQASNNTLVIVNAPADLSTDDIAYIVRGLKKVDLQR